MEATHLYAWDRAPRGIGRLDEIDAGLNRLAFDYDLAGHTTTRVYTRGVIALAVRADHDPVTGLLDTLTYPSGAAIQYQYDTAGRISGLTWDGEPIADQLQYTAFSAIKALRLANGLDHLRAHDSAGRIASYTLAGETVQIGYDAAGRLTGYQAPTRTETHAYDASGNRLSRTVNGQTTAYQYLANSNRLQTLDALAIAHDAAGNRLADLGRQYAHDSAGRLVQLAAGATLARYEYDGLGERTFKQVGAELRHFAYDGAGHLLGEYDAAGQPLAEYAWLGDLPVAYRVYRHVNGLAQTDLYAVEADHLGTPRALTDQAQNLRWRWHAAPFGDTAPDQNPSGLGPLTFNLRFPGQYYDAESGLHYNTFRDYDPGTGRYVQSDPIGLEGGINTYAYAIQNPLAFSDPTGQAVPLIPAIPVIIKACSATAAAIIGIMTGVAIVEVVDCDSCEKKDDLCNQLAKEARGKAKRVQEHVDTDHFHSKPCVDLNITLTRAVAAGCDMSDSRFQTAIEVFNRVCTNPKNFPPPYGGKPGGPPFDKN